MREGYKHTHKKSDGKRMEVIGSAFPSKLSSIPQTHTDAPLRRIEILFTREGKRFSDSKPEEEKSPRFRLRTHNTEARQSR